MSVVLRWIADDRITGACPNHLIERTGDHVILYQPGGTLWRVARGVHGGPRGRNLLPGHPIDGHDQVEWTGQGVVRAHRFGEPWSTWRWYDHGVGWSDYFYVNLEDPWRETALGFDSGDWVLDVIVGPDGRSRYKDLDELEWIEASGKDSAWTGRARAAGVSAIAAAEHGAWPFSADWDSWIPTISDLPVLPEEWAADVTPGTGR